MLTYEQFEQYMNRLVAAEEKSAELFKVLGYCEGIFECMAVDTAIDLLSLLMEDSESWISYWMYEKDFGAIWTEDEDSVTMEGRPVICKTLRQLYDFLVENARTGKATVSA